MTIQEIIDSNKLFLTPDDVCDILNADPATIRKQAEVIGFPISVMGNRTRIPRLPFLRFLGYDKGVTV